MKGEPHGNKSADVHTPIAGYYKKISGHSFSRLWIASVV